MTAGLLPPSAQLRRTLSARDLIVIVVGTVIGSGIFLTPGAVVRSAGSGGMALVVWTIGGILSLLGALTFAELGSARPDSGGLYTYLRDAFGAAVAFLYGWTMFLVIGSGSLATLAAAFPRYVGVFVPLSPSAERVISVVMVAAVAALNVRGTRVSADAQGVATAIKVTVLVGLAALLCYTSPGAASGGAPSAALPSGGIGGAITAMIGVLWAYEGWQYVTFSAGETVDPQRTFVRGIVVGTALLAGIYLVANVGYFAALGVDGVARSRTVASEAASAALGPAAAKVVAAVILVSIVSAANGLMLTLPRLFFAMARDRLFFARLADVHPRFGTPAVAIVATAIWSAVLLASGSFEQLLTYVVFMSWVWFALAALTIFVGRRRVSSAPPPFRTPGYPVTPVVFVAAALVIVVNTVVAQPVQSLAGLALAALGVPAYLRWRPRRAGTTRR